jgi:hypothetical protein
VLFAKDVDELRTYTYRAMVASWLPGTLVDHLVVVQDSRDFNQRFIDTEFIRWRIPMHYG